MAADENDSFGDCEIAPSPFSFVASDGVNQEGGIDAVLSDSNAIHEDNEVDWEAVGRAYAEVSDDCRTMLHCFYVEEKSLGECGARISLRENSAKVKRFRCAQRLKSLYIQYKRE